MIKEKCILIISLFVLSLFPVYAQDNPWVPIVELATRDKRFAGKPLSKEECEEERKAMIDKGCLLPQYLAYLVEKDACPQCTSRGKISGVSFIGCFARGTRIFAQRKGAVYPVWIAIEELVDQIDEYDVWTLSKGSDFRNPRYHKLSLTSSLQGPEYIPLVVISTGHGTQIKLTEGHPVLFATGKIVRADSVVVGDELVTMDGRNTSVLSIQRESSKHDVYNVMTSGNEIYEHILISEGLLMGDRMLQNLVETAEQKTIFLF